jgi:hypothetical protein
MRFRQGGFVLHPDDYKEDPQPQRKRIYYWCQLKIEEKNTQRY